MKINIYFFCLLFGKGWNSVGQGGIICGSTEEASRSSKAIDERVIIDFRDKNAVIARFRGKNDVFDY